MPQQLWGMLWVVPRLLAPGSGAAVLELAVGWGNWEGPDSWGTEYSTGRVVSLLPCPLNI